MALKTNEIAINGRIVDTETGAITNAPPKLSDLFRPGRGSKLTEDIIIQINGDILAGLSHKDASIVAGVTQRTFYTWKNKGRQLQAHLDLNLITIEELANKDLLYLQFFHAITIAEPLQKRNLILKIRLAADKAQHWTAAAWLLERKYPQEFGRVVKLETNWRDEAKDKGIDAEEMMEQMIVDMVETMVDDVGKFAEEADFTDLPNVGDDSNG